MSNNNPKDDRLSLTKRTPLASKARLNLPRFPFRDRGTPSTFSYRVMVAAPTPDRLANSRTDQFSAPRAARNCIPVKISALLFRTTVADRFSDGCCLGIATAPEETLVNLQAIVTHAPYLSDK